MTHQEIAALLERYHNDTCTPEEIQLVEEWYLHITATTPQSDLPEDLEEQGRQVYAAIIAKQRVKPNINRLYAIAACITIFLIVSGTGIIFLKRFGPGTQHPNAIVRLNDIPPGSNRAILTLASGEQVDLAAAQKGSIAVNSGIAIQKADSGKIIYDAAIRQPEKPAAIAYNTITTPNGGTYQLILQDGTKVWLNAGSRITYPVTFQEVTERKVQLAGEAYFEVTKAPHKPFVVEVTNQRIAVLGTHFNVSCYLNEPVKTTLAEGKVEISLTANAQKATLKPGQQSIVVNAREIKVQQVDPEEFTSWKDGLFVFSGTPLKAALIQISRWYDVDVDLTGIPNELIEGEIQRNATLLQALKSLETGSGIPFKLEGRRIMRK